MEQGAHSHSYCSMHGRQPVMSLTPRAEPDVQLGVRTVLCLCVCRLQARSLSGTPRREPGRRSSQSAASGSQLQRQQEAALQRILEEEILKEMDREAALREVRPSVCVPACLPACGTCLDQGWCHACPAAAARGSGMVSVGRCADIGAALPWKPQLTATCSCCSG